MPVPKRKTSRARKRSRSANKGIKVKAFTRCANCDTAIMPHQACMSCGFYKGVKMFSTKLDRNIKRKEVKKAKESKKPSDSQMGPIEAESTAAKE